MRRVLLINWDSYPHVASGGVSTWARGLVENMPDCEFTIFNQLSNPNSNSNLRLPPNVKSVIGMPVFGTTRLEEFFSDGSPLLPKLRRTTESVIVKRFLPLYKAFLESILADSCDPDRLAQLVFELHNFLTVYDSKKCFEHPQTWDAFLERVRTDPLYKEMKLREALTNYHVLQRSMQVLSVKLPKVDIIHTSLAWLPSLLGVSAKIEHGSSFLLTEHGVAFRELLLYYNTFLYSEASKLFWTVFTHNVVRTIYKSADVIIPVCRANTTWETKLGADAAKVKVIYNGVDTDRFRPLEVAKDPRPTVVSVARISVFKDIIALIQATDRVRQSVKNVRCLLYGDSTEPEYYERCADEVKKLHLEKTFYFMGGTKEPEKAYAVGDVVAFSSITEGFPFAVIEAMACGKAIVATDVGGVSEALDRCGLLVKSRSSHDLAEGILRLLNEGGLRHDMEQASLARASREFSLGKCIQQYRETYDELAYLEANRNERAPMEAMPQMMVTS
jgi:glycosyltransferase involved in cell wall biosynthesis